MTYRDLRQLAYSLIQQARIFKMQGETELAASLMRRTKTIRTMVSSITAAEAALIPFARHASDLSVPKFERKPPIKESSVFQD